MYHGLDPLKLLDYPAEDVFNLIAGTIQYNTKHSNDTTNNVVRRKAGDDWF